MNSQSYILSKIGVSTNALELKNSQQRLLLQNYPKNYQIRNSRPQQSDDPNSIIGNKLSELNSFTPSSYENKSLFNTRTNSLPRLRNVHEQIIKNSLSNQLSNQIFLKQQLRKHEINQKIKLQKQMIKFNKILEDKEISKNKKFIQSFKQQAFHTAQMKELKKQEQKHYHHLEKKQIGTQYRNGNQIIEKLIKGVNNEEEMNKNLLNKNLNRISQSSIENYNLNPQIGILPKRSVHKPSYEQASELKIMLKQTLLEQMRFNSERKMNQKNKKINTPFIDEKFKFKDNPIINPVDFKIAKDNPYVMKQLLASRIIQEKNEASSNIMGKNEKRYQQVMKTRLGGNNPLSTIQPSYLSLRGSNSLSQLNN